MEIRILTNGTDLRRYNEWILTNPEGSLWQSLERKHYLEACGNSVRIYVAEDDPGHILASALISIDKTTGGLSTWEIARGPLWTKSNQLVTALLEKIINDAKDDRCIAVYFSPATVLPAHHDAFTTASRHVYPEATRIVDLTKTEDEILAQMHPKGRYNIGVAKKHSIEVSEGSSGDIEAFYELLKGTGSRDGFKISQKSHYTRFLSHLRDSFILMANYQGKPVAGLIGVLWPPPLTPPPRGEGNFSRTGIYYYGASSYEHRHLMAPYLLQWEAIRQCKNAGCMRYDLLGIAPENAGTDDPWAGISDFKRKFGGTVVSYPPEQMIVLQPIVKKMLEWKRRVVG